MNDDQHNTTPPRRIQRSRAKGWRMPEGAVYVGRPSMDSNPFLVIQDGPRWGVWRNGSLEQHQARDRADAHDLAVALYRRDMEAACARDPQAADLMRMRLRGRDLCCWCPPGLACHADVLLEIANV